MVVEVVSTLEENVASFAMSAWVSRPEEALSVSFGLEVNVELLTSRKGLVAIEAGRM